MRASSGLRHRRVHRQLCRLRILPFDDNVDGFDDRFVVSDNVGTDGVDTLKHIERLQFADQAVVLGGTD